MVRRSTLLAILIPAGVLVLLVAAGVLLAPRLAGRVLDRALPAVRSACDCEIAYERVSYSVTGALRVRGLTILGDTASIRSEISVSELRTRIGPFAALQLWRNRGAISLPARPIPEDPREISAWAAPLLNDLAFLSRLPSSVTISGINGSFERGSISAVVADADVLINAARATAPSGPTLATAVAFSGDVTGTSTSGPDGGAGLLFRGPVAVEVNLSSDAPALVVALRVVESDIRAGDAATALLNVDLLATLSPNEPAEVSGTMAIRDAVLRIPALAPDPVEALSVGYRFSALYDPDIASAPVHIAGAPPAELPPAFGRLTVVEGELSVNGIGFAFAPELSGVTQSAGAGEGLGGFLLGAERYLNIELDLPLTDAEFIRDSLPASLLGPLEAARLAGRVGWSLDLHVPLHAVSRMSWVATVPQEDFGVSRISWDTNVYKLNGPFVATIVDPAVNYDRSVLIPSMRLPSSAWTSELSEFRPQTIERWRREDAALAARVAANPPSIVRTAPAESDPDPDPTYRYVRLEQMSRWIPRAVLTAEDGDFFYYQGVNFYTLPRALERNLLAGEIQFGASTLSMQLVKMLFLDAGRIISRKLQEVFLVHLMENVVPVAKERILELYINLAEFGPGVFGIADAAWYYFRASPADLTAGQAVWLASILPSPKRYHQYYEAGGISPGWFERMKGYFAIMVERGRMTPEEYADAALAPPRFAYSTVEDAE